jgi:hypothetical protein
MNDDFYDRIRESIRIRGERPASVQYEEMIARGAIDRDGNVLIRRPDTSQIPHGLPSMTENDSPVASPPMQFAPLNGERHPRSCQLCNGYRVPSEIVLIRIRWDGPQNGCRPVEYHEVAAGYAGIRAVCTSCLAGLAGIWEEGRGRATIPMVQPAGTGGEAAKPGGNPLGGSGEASSGPAARPSGPVVRYPD